MSTNKIAIIIPYYGKWQSYFNIFIKSCSYNEDVVDYLFFTDLQPPVCEAKNIFFYQYSWSEINALINSKLELDLELYAPYKFCDLRPAYGNIFSDYISKYEYWGHGDEDLILGNLNNYLSNLVGEFDLISFRKEWNSGSFCLFRNTDFINQLYKQSKEYPQVFLTKKFEGFDETILGWPDYRKIDFNILDVDKHSMTYVVKKNMFEGKLKAHYQTLIKECIDDGDYVVFDKGQVFDNHGKEYVIYHFIVEKKRFQFEFPNWKIVPDKYYIDNTGFFTEDEFNQYRQKIRAARKRKGQVKKVSYYLKRLKEKIILKG